MFHSAYQKILRKRGRGRDSLTNNTELTIEYGSVPKHLRGVCLVKKDEYLIRNGASLFKELVKSTRGKNNPFRIFSLKELQKATNNFSANMCLKDSFPLTYRGVIEDRHVAMKFSNIREIVSLSLIKHRNVVKLMGCCLETESPIVVHELPPNGTLTRKPLPVEVLWTDRLIVATEIADVLAYLHSEHITHGGLSYFDAVLLDEFHSPKLGAFDCSEIQNQAKSSINELRRMKEEYVETDFRYKYNKCEDVDNFGKILLNVLGIDDGEVFECKEKVIILKYIDLLLNVKYLKVNVSEKEMPQIEAYVDLLLRCRKVSEKDGELSMEEVARELRRIRSMMNHQPTTHGNESDNLSSGANASSSNNASTSYQEVTSDYL